MSTDAFGKTENNSFYIGILGDGQLALMLAEAALRQKIGFFVLGEDFNSSMAIGFPDQFVFGKKGDSTVLLDFAKKCSALTLENEFFTSALLKQTVQRTEDRNTRLVPDWESYSHFESKSEQRLFYDSLSIPGPKWQPVTDAQKVPEGLSFPLMLKADRGGYDGYGVRSAENWDEWASGLRALGFFDRRGVIAEQKLKIKNEFAQGVLLDGAGNCIFLPLVETVQKQGICEMVLSRPSVSGEELLFVRQEVKKALQKIIQSGLKGLFHFEFFLTEDRQVFINEGAPRPHNSQHLTLNASPISQFDLLVSFLKDSHFVEKWNNREIETFPAVMVNLLGKSSGPGYSLGLPRLPESVEVYPKLYLKKECRPGRKMGHVNLVHRGGEAGVERLLIESAHKILKEYTL